MCNNTEFKPNSHKIVEFKCDHCSCDVKQEYRNYIKSKDGLHLCRSCRNKQSVSSKIVREKIATKTKERWATDKKYREAVSNGISAKKKEWWKNKNGIMILVELREYVQTISDSYIITDEYDLCNDAIAITLTAFDKVKDKKYHQNKYLECKDKGIRLIQIFEHEWIQKQDRIKSVLKNIFGKNTHKVGSRKCTLKVLSVQEYRDFLEENHIQGYANARYKIGLYYEDMLVSCLGVGLSRFKKNQMEIVRFVNKMDYTINGAFGKLLKYYLKNYYKDEEIASFSDLRYFTGSGYTQNGFSFLGLTLPNYYYTKDGTVLFNRIQFQKHKLKEILEVYDEDKTEVENMLSNGYIQLFDGGQLKFVYKRD